MSRRRLTPPPRSPKCPPNFDKHAASPVKDAADIVDNTSPQDDRQQIEKLCRLPPHYSSVAAGRALRAVGLTGPATLADLAAAADLPPEPPRAAERLTERFARAGGAPTGEQVRGPDGRWTRIQAPQTPPPSAVAEAQATDERWIRLDALRPAAKWAADDLARRSEQWADDAWLAAAPEPDLRERAKLAAEALKPAIITRAAREGRGLTPFERRRIDPAAQLRMLRKRAKAARQFWAAALQLTGGRGKAPCFADDYTFARWRERQDRARTFGQLHVWVRDDGKEFSTWDIMQASAVANLNRLYVQMRGVEDLAEGVGLDAVMITLTLPGSWHPNPRDGECTWTMKEHTPIEADRELQRLWAQFRARLGRLKVCVLGLRVVEAHTDGCPHLHALLFVTDDQADAVDAALRATRPDDWDDLPSDDEKTKERKAAERAERIRLDNKMRVATSFLRIDRRRARPSTYVLKYLLKSLNVDPAVALKTKGLDPEATGEIRRAVTDAAIKADIQGIEPGEDQIADYGRHRALASERGWRRYSLLGVHGMQRVWQRLFRLEEPEEGAPAAVVETWEAVRRQPAMFAAWRAMRGRQWAEALCALGAVRHPAIADRDTPRAKLVYEPYTNDYGEAARRPVGVRWSASDDWAIRLSDWTWTLGKSEQKKTADKAAAKEADTLNSLISKARTFADNYPRFRGDTDRLNGGRVAVFPPPGRAGPPETAYPASRRGSMLVYIDEIGDAA